MKYTVLYKNPHHQSQASLRALQYSLWLQCPCKYREWLEFRQKTLTRMQSEVGVLACHYCSKGPLIIDTTNKDPMVATLDHVVARANGGAEFDRSNLVVSCYRCNQKKGAT